MFCEKNCKAPGDDIIGKFRCHLERQQREQVYLMKFWKWEIIPKQCSTSTIIVDVVVLLQKKGDKDDINNYRPLQFST